MNNGKKIKINIHKYNYLFIKKIIQFINKKYIKACSIVYYSLVYVIYHLKNNSYCTKKKIKLSTKYITQKPMKNIGLSKCQAQTLNLKCLVA